MRALVVYESMFGNTEQIARAIADGLGRYGAVEVRNVDDMVNVPLQGIDLLIVGGPTHAFGMSRPRTRESAAQQSATPTVTKLTGVREWLQSLAPPEPGATAAAFDTRIRKPSWLPGLAAKSAARSLRRSGYRPAADPASFFVTGVSGPVAQGELARARQWGGSIGSACLERSAAP